MAASSGHADSGSNESNAKSDRPAQVLIAARYRDQSRQPPQPAALPAKKKKKKERQIEEKVLGKREKNASPHCSGGTCPARRRMAAEANPRSRSRSSRTMRLPYWTASGKHHHLAEIHRQHTGPALMIPTTSSVAEAIRQPVDLDLRSRSARLRIVVPERIPPRPPPPRPRGERRPRSPDQPPSSDWRSYSPPGSSAPPESEAAASWRGYSPPRPTGAPPNQCPICGTVLRASGGPRAVDAALAAHHANSTKCLAKGKGKAYRRPRCPRCNKAIADNDWAREQHSWHCTG